MYERFVNWYRAKLVAEGAKVTLVLHTSCVNYPAHILREMARLQIRWFLPQSVAYELRLLTESAYFGERARLLLELERRSERYGSALLCENWDLEELYSCCSVGVSPEQICSGTMVFWFGDLNKQDEFLRNVREMKGQYILMQEKWSCSGGIGEIVSVEKVRKRAVRCCQPLDPGPAMKPLGQLSLRDEVSLCGSDFRPTGMSGRYAAIYTSDAYPGKLVKLYTGWSSDGNSVRKLQKLRDLNRGQKLPALALPERLLWLDEKYVAGYVMKKCPGESICNLRAKGWGGHDLRKVFRNLLLLLLELHTMRILVNDLSFNNVLVDEEDRVYLVDCDSFQVSHFPGGSMTDIYRHPQVLKEAGGCILREPRHEYFALAVLLFQCLFYNDPLAQSQERDDERVLNWNNAIFPLDVGRDRMDLPRPNALTERNWFRQPERLRKLFADEFHFRRDYSFGAWIQGLGLL